MSQPPPPSPRVSAVPRPHSNENFQFMFPETAGKTLEEVAEIFEDPNGPKYIGTPAWKTRVEYRRAVALEHGEIDYRKHKLDDHSPERVEHATEEKV